MFAEIKKYKKNLKKYLSQGKKTLLKASDASNDFDAYLNKIEQLQKERIATDDKFIKTFAKIKRLKGKSRRMLWFSNMVCFLIILLVSLLFFSPVYTDNVGSVAIVFSIIYIGFIILFNEITNQIYIFLSLKKLKQYESDEGEKYISELQEFPLQKIMISETEPRISNKVIKKIAGIILITTIVLLIVFSRSGYLSAKNQKEFYYLQSGADTYVVIYNNGEYLTLKRTYVDNDRIVIDLGIQKNISSEDIVLYKKSFEEVEIIPIK